MIKSERLHPTLYAVFALTEDFRNTTLIERWRSDELEYCLFELSNLFDEVLDMRDDARPASDYFKKVSQLYQIYACYHEVISPLQFLFLEQYLYALLAEMSATKPNVRDNAQHYTALFLALSKDTLISCVQYQYVPVRAI